MKALTFLFLVIALVPGARSGEQPVHDVEVRKDIRFAGPEGVDLLLNLHLPKGVNRPPLVMFIHGGGWKNGDRSRCRLCWVARYGFAVASIEYRLSHEAIFPAQIEDCKGALRWLRAHAGEYGYDASRVVVAGTSAGGHLAALMGTTGNVDELEGDTGGNLEESTRVQGVINYFGPTDFLMRSRENPAKTEDPKGSVFKLFGGSVSQNRDIAAAGSPVHHITTDDPPLLVVHGTADKTVRVSQAHRIVNAYRENGLDVTLHLEKGKGHGWALTDTEREIVLGFLTRILQPRSSIGSWKSIDSVEQWQFDTGEVTGVFVARDDRDLGKGYGRHGLRDMIFLPTGMDLQAPSSKVGAKRRHQGHLNLYRVYAGSETLGSLRDEAAMVERLQDGARLTWESTIDRPVTVVATWRLTGPAQFDLELSARPVRDLKNFEILPASYCPVEMRKFVYLQGEHSPVEVKGAADGDRDDLYPFFPCSSQDRLPQEQSGRIQSPWKWKTQVMSDLVRMPVLFAADEATEILLLGDPASVSAVCATPRPDHGNPEDWNSVEQHSALYLSFFCRDIKADETVTARARLIFRGASVDPAAEHQALYRKFMDEL